MNSLLLACEWTVAVVQLPSYGFLLLAIPVAGVLAIKLGGLTGAKAPKKSQGWIPSGDVDENGLPLMARANTASPEAQMRAAVAAYQPRSRR
ncbi:MAG TPA: hypothetical protein VE291_13835 [Terracidiphilus sp.]|jgi:hypothetical protein|nr:hypothetical protein [Terracidiphilus sp.]